MDKKVLDCTCGSRSIWFDKNNPLALYTDIRQEHYTASWKGTTGSGISERVMTIEPDMIVDFTDMPFEDNSFSLVVWDPPHLKQGGETAWLIKKYGRLDDNWNSMLHDGFKECMRVLKPDGVLIFKWSEIQIPATEVWKAIGQRPLFGHHSGKRSNTFWACFMKEDSHG